MNLESQIQNEYRVEFLHEIKKVNSVEVEKLLKGGNKFKAQSLLNQYGIIDYRLLINSEGVSLNINEAALKDINAIEVLEIVFGSQYSKNVCIISEGFVKKEIVFDQLNNEYHYLLDGICCLRSPTLKGLIKEHII